MPRRLRPPPQPLRVDAVRVVALGTGLWLVALLVLLVFVGRLAESDQLLWLWTALAGFLLGLLGLRLCVVRRTRQRRGTGARS